MVFDLWGTLVDELTYPEANRRVYRQRVDETADLLDLDRDAFAEAWGRGGWRAPGWRVLDGGGAAAHLRGG